ncbi:nucleoside deaminase [Methanolobus chelungpuianus]|uniref:Cytosine deaminase n=1 Tax=Methanolobus chelungpuianus TaxID=502115 RepID=A0AAE3HBH5_9EURY|nr:nucleoside deaminase [Methanolobus chelungpuianus]MCQ6963617.1 cytosine deaminase [Methanolobus chelungpuianus]
MNYFMQTAIDEARHGMDHNHGGPFGAVIVKDGEIISRAHNEVLRTNDPTAHAEILAIRQASELLDRFDLSDCEIYTTSEPCPMCLAAIYWARIRTVYFGSGKEDVARIGFDDSRFYEIIRSGNGSELSRINIEKEKCLELLKRWEKKPDKQMY